MKVLKTLGLAVLTVTMIAALLTQAWAQDEKPTIKEIMKTAHKGQGALWKKVAKGKATADEKQQLVTLYKALAAAKPPKGDQAGWDERTATLVAAAKAAVAGQPDASQQLQKATSCAACHKAHKP